MKILVRSALVAGVAASALLALAPVSAQPAAQAAHEDDGSNDDDIVVIASRSGDAVNRNLIGSSVTVIDPAQIEDRETRIVSDVLRDVPGVAVSRSGAVGGETDIRIRGSEANHVLVFIDGIKADDAYQGQFDFATLFADDAARIEVLRGQQSSLYGSDAIGGVINYTTLSGHDLPGIRLRAEGGSMGTYDGAARVAGMIGSTFDYALSGVYYHTDGYPTAPGGTRDVGSESVGASAKLGWKPTTDFSLTGVLRYSHTDADTNDQGITPDAPLVSGRPMMTVIDSPGTYYRNRSWYGLVRADLNSFGDAMTTSASAQFADIRRDGYDSDAYSFGDQGVRYRGSINNTVRFGNDHVKNRFTLAIDAQREEYRNVAPSASDPSTHHLDTIGFVAQYNLTVNDRLAIGGSARIDKNDYFQDDSTWHVEASYLFPSQTRLHAAAGSGIKNPVSFELFGYATGQYIGNPNLKPEKSQGWEAGIDQSFAHGAATVGVTYFKNRLTDAIYTAYLPPDYSGTSLNQDTATHQQGVEVFGQAKLGAVRVDLAYTYLDAPQLRTVLLNPADLASFDTGSVEAQAVRRPKNSGSVNVTYAPKDSPFSGTLTVRYNGRMKDVAYDANYLALYTELKAYTLVNLAVRYKLTGNVELYARAENLFDDKYQEVFTFRTPGRAVYGGVRAHF